VATTLATSLTKSALFMFSLSSFLIE